METLKPLAMMNRDSTMETTELLAFMIHYGINRIQFPMNDLSNDDNVLFCINTKINSLEKISSQQMQMMLTLLNTCRSSSASFRIFYVSTMRMSSKGRAHPKISASPLEALIDEKIVLQVEGLVKNQPITVQASLTEGGHKYASCACFLASENGEVSLSTDPSLQGTYTGVSDMGLFWSMEPVPGQRKGLRLIKTDPMTPYEVQVSVFHNHHSFQDLYSEGFSINPLSTVVVKRSYVAKGVQKRVIKEGRLRGSLFLPSGSGPFAGVIDMFGTVGGLTEYRSAMLASRGFAALALPYFRYEDLPYNLEDIELEYFLEAADWLSSQSFVRAGGIGVIGVSKGGELALMMGTYSPKASSFSYLSNDCVMVKAVVNIGGPPFLSAAGMYFKGQKMKPVELDISKLDIHADGSLSFRNCLPYRKDDIIKVWESDAKVLNIIGDDDQSCPSESLQLLLDCYPPHKCLNVQLKIYPGAGHLIEIPYAPHFRMTYHKTYGQYFLWGGKPKPHADAQEDAWKSILDHFRTHLLSSFYKENLHSSL
ncbi:hypothetical protein CHS0354_032931 [Potamilus streckersoni]|uniref:Uncharacterized protein n=1 Tax=Potamilus streckersoni TaxID=2493646 RepID=A0AAE0RX29_9BIVA|nr:hypothetical protein CHS0354_032931 [Potamilus streckersoni]